MSVTHKNSLVYNKARPGDKLIITKPLGSRHATNIKEWIVKDHPFKKECQKYMTT